MDHVINLTTFLLIRFATILHQIAIFPIWCKKMYKIILHQIFIYVIWCKIIAYLSIFRDLLQYQKILSEKNLVIAAIPAI